MIRHMHNTEKTFYDDTFAKIDNDKDGIISDYELHEFLNENFSIRTAEIKTQTIQKEISTPGGTISNEQFLRAAQSMSLTISPIANKQFTKLDADGDGYITVPDLKHVLCVCFFFMSRVLCVCVCVCVWSHVDVCVCVCMHVGMHVYCVTRVYLCNVFCA